MSQKLDNINGLVPEVRQRIGALAQACEWPEFERQIDRHLTNTTLPRHVILPLASAAAVGGEPRRALSAAVACAYLIVASRWFDDSQDRDRPESLWSDVGMGRAVNMAAAALTVAWRALAEDKELPNEALQAFGRRTVELSHGQELDLLAQVPRNLDEYWQVMRGKTGAAVALGCEVGALSARPDKPADARVCGRFGEYTGTLLQILDDLDGAFHPDGVGDLRLGKITLPTLYGLAVDHDSREELAEFVHCGTLAQHADRVLEILETIDTREFLVWCGFEERRQALDVLKELAPGENEMADQGRQALRAFVDSLMVGWESLISRHRRPEFEKFAWSNPEPVSSGAQ